MVLKDNKTLQEECDKIGIKRYKLFAEFLLFRSYDGANIGLSSKMSKKEVDKIKETINEKMHEFVKFMKIIPHSILLVLRNK